MNINYFFKPRLGGEEQEKKFLAIEQEISEAIVQQNTLNYVLHSYVQMYSPTWH